MSLLGFGEKNEGYQEMKLVATIVLMEPEAHRMLLELASLDEVGEEVEPLRELMAENNWTPDMLLGGMLLSHAIVDESNGVGLNEPKLEVVERNK